MGRLTEVIHLVNCSAKEWNKYSNNDYLFYSRREEVKRLRKLNNNNK